MKRTPTLILLALVAAGSFSVAALFSAYQNTATLQSGDLFIIERPNVGNYNITASQLPGALGLASAAFVTTNTLQNYASNGAVVSSLAQINTTSNSLQSGINGLGSNLTNDVNTTSNVLAGLVTGGGAPLAITITNSGDGNFNNHAYTNASRIGFGNYFWTSNQFGGLLTNPVDGTGLIVSNGLVKINGLTLANTNQIMPQSTTAVPATNQYAYFNGDNGVTNVGSTINGQWWTNIYSTNIVGNIATNATTGNKTNYTIPLMPGAGVDPLVINCSSTNMFITFANTNQANWKR